MTVSLLQRPAIICRPRSHPIHITRKIQHTAVRMTQTHPPTTTQIDRRRHSLERLGKGDGGRLRRHHPKQLERSRRKSNRSSLSRHGSGKRGAREPNLSQMWSRWSVPFAKLVCNSAHPSAAAPTASRTHTNGRLERNAPRAQWLGMGFRPRSTLPREK